MKIDPKSEIVQKMKLRYNDKIHPLAFQRSVERAKTNVQLFDLLETYPDKYPVAWNYEKECWETVTDLF